MERTMVRRFNLRHSPVGWVARKTLHALFRARYGRQKPVTYRLPRSIEIRLYPEGEVAEFLAFPGLFENEEMQLIAAYLKPGMKMVDVGANIGLYSVLASSIVGDSGRIWAFEPSAESFNRLVRNLRLNGCVRVQPIQVALSSEADQVLCLTSDTGYGDAYRYAAPVSGKKSTLGSEVVRATTTDACATEYGIRDVDLMKIDVEGGEYRTLLGAREFLSANPELMVVFESEPDWCKRSGCKQSDAMDLLLKTGFQLYAWNKSKRLWEDDPRKLLRSGMLWATRDRARLPSI
jgi:FkbM family methyltransferase